jgi:mono/diheme cytochrome c family protein
MSLYSPLPSRKEMRVDRAVLLSSIAAVVVGTGFVVAQDRTADQGVYTSAQAARGGTAFEAHCVSCHREGGTAPVLAGERFTKSFADSTLLSVFTTIQTTMPRQAPGSLTESEYLDILAHLLKLNRYPDGLTELTATGLVDIKVPGKGGTLEFTLVHVVGCLSRTGRVWTLSKATEPVRTRAPEAATDAEAAELDGTPLGARSFRLQQVYGAPSGWTGQKVAAKGFLTRSGSEERVNVTSMRTLTTACPE